MFKLFRTLIRTPIIFNPNNISHLNDKKQTTEKHSSVCITGVKSKTKIWFWQHKIICVPTPVVYFLILPNKEKMYNLKKLGISLLIANKFSNIAMHTRVNVKIENSYGRWTNLT